MAALHPSTTRMSETISATELHHSMGHYSLDLVMMLGQLAGVLGRHDEACVTECRAGVEAGMISRYECACLADFVDVGQKHGPMLAVETQKPTQGVGFSN